LISAALETGKPTKIALHPTLADGLAIPQVGTNGFEIAQSHVDKTLIVTEEQIAISILRMVELEKGVVEGALCGVARVGYNLRFVLRGKG